MSVYSKLMTARVMLHGQQIKKSGHNKFANYHYMELGDFLIPTQTIFASLGLCGVVSFTADVACLVIVDTEDLSQITITSPMGSAALKGCHEVQNIGAVETYQRRYLWVTAMEIVEHDALDSSPPPEDNLEQQLKDSIEQVKQKKAGVMSATLPAVEAALDTNTRIALNKLAEKVTSYHKQGAYTSAFDSIEEQGLDGDEKTYLWSLLDSGCRSKLKREGIERTMRATVERNKETV
jgi:hypothetical protein